MANAERPIVETYSALFERLSSASKLELLERLAKSIKKGRKSNKKKFSVLSGHLHQTSLPKK